MTAFTKLSSNIFHTYPTLLRSLKKGESVVSTAPSIHQFRYYSPHDVIYHFKLRSTQTWCIVAPLQTIWLHRIIFIGKQSHFLVYFQLYYKTACLFTSLFYINPYRFIRVVFKSISILSFEMFSGVAVTCLVRSVEYSFNKHYVY